MNCLTCSSPIVPLSRKYCSRSCYDRSKFGRKRPDVAMRNKTNNPVWDPAAREKMRQSLTGMKQSNEQKRKRSISLKQYYASHPEAKARLAKNVWDKYTSKIAGTGWRSIRSRVLERDGHACTYCGETSYRLLLVHHLDWSGNRGNNEMKNLIVLCHKCHNSIHRHKSSDYQDRKRSIAP